MKTQLLSKLIVLSAMTWSLMLTTDSLCALTLSYPNGGETLRTGEHHDIYWIGNPDISDNVNIELTQGGYSISTDIASNIPDDGSFSWKVPVELARHQYKIKISYVHHNNIYDYSDEKINFIEPSLYITSPQGGEVWQINSKQMITWDSSSYEGEVFISCSGVENIITWSAPNSGSFEWTVPDIGVEKRDNLQIMIKIQNNYGGTEEVYSNAFTITRRGSSTPSSTVNSYSSSSFPEALVAEWYDDASGGWNVSIRRNPNLTIRTGNVFYTVKQTEKQGSLYRVLTQRQGTSEYHTFFFKNVTTTSMSINHTLGNASVPQGTFSGHYTK